MEEGILRKMQNDFQRLIKSKGREAAVMGQMPHNHNIGKGGQKICK